MDILTFLFVVSLIGNFFGWVVLPVWWTLVPKSKGFAKNSPPDFKLYRGLEGLDG